MITCPLCHRHVHLDNDGRDTNTLLTEKDPSDFYCPTYVDVHPGVRWSHYVRRKGLPASTNGLRYTAISPPFEFIWTDHDQRLVVRQFNILPDDFRFNKIIYEAKVPFEKLLEVYQRFSNLRVFS